MSEKLPRLDLTFGWNADISTEAPTDNHLQSGTQRCFNDPCGLFVQFTIIFKTTMYLTVSGILTDDGVLNVLNWDQV